MSPTPTPQQLQVIESTERDILVEAGAGSGKTTTMVDRYVHLLGERGLEPRQILAFTFTDKAAGELREKVRQARQTLAAREGAGNPAAISMSDAWVGTFHAICTRILKAWPVEAGVDPGFEVIDDVTAETVREAAFGDALQAFRDEASEPGAREAMIGLITERTLRGTVISAYDELRSRGVREPRLPEFAPTPFPEEEIRRLAGIAPGLLDVKGATASQKEKLAAIIELVGRDFRCEELAPLAFESTREGFREFCELMPVLLGKLAAHEFGDGFRRDLGRLLELFGRRYAGQKERRSVLDYEDLQLVAVDLLRQHRRIREGYRDRFREIMVDEFQDTNRLQLELVELLRGEEATLITVGDEMQSIYGFRHAEVELFRSRREAPGIAVYQLTDNFRSEPQVIAAVNLVGGALDRTVDAVRGGDGGAGRHRFAELTIGLESSGESSVEIVATEREGWKELDLGPIAPAISEGAAVGKEVDHFNEAEALRLAHRLKELVDAGEARQGEIAVLLRARTRAPLYVAALRQVGLDPYLAGGTGFWDSREAMDIRALLSVVANPRDDESLLTVLASPICGLSSDALWTIGLAAPGRFLWERLLAGIEGDLRDPATEDAAPLTDEDRARAAEFAESLTELRGVASLSSLPVLVERAVETTAYDLVTLAGDPSGNGLAAVRRISSLAREYEAAEGRDLRGFLDWIALSADLDSESAVATVEEDSDVVRIMTVHAAKGLEFGVVCVPDCGRASVNRHSYPLLLGRPGSGEPGATSETDFALGMRLKLIGGANVELYDWARLKAQAGDRLEDEELRLFHVALTRAKRRLIVSGVPPKKFPGSKGSPAQSRSMILRICESFDLDPAEIDSWPGGVGEETGESIADLVLNRPSPETARILAGAGERTDSNRELQVVDPPLFRPPFRVFPDLPLSFTALSEYAECPTRFYSRRVLGMSEAAQGSPIPTVDDPSQASTIEREQATGFGLAVHETLEALGSSRAGTPFEAMLRKSLDRHGISSRESRDRAANMVSGFLATELGERAMAGDAALEVPLLLNLEGMTIRGFVDALIEGTPPLIVDYKTNRLDGADPEERMAPYEIQGKLYALALARATDRTEVDTAFVFLERPDSPVRRRLGPRELELAEEELRVLVEEIGRGEFFGGPGSSHQPCGECGACRALSIGRREAAR